MRKKFSSRSLKISDKLLIVIVVCVPLSIITIFETMAYREWKEGRGDCAHVGINSTQVCLVAPDVYQQVIAASFMVFFASLAIIVLVFGFQNIFEFEKEPDEG